MSQDTLLAASVAVARPQVVTPEHFVSCVLGLSSALVELPEALLHPGLDGLRLFEWRRRFAGGGAEDVGVAGIGHGSWSGIFGSALSMRTKRNPLGPMVVLPSHGTFTSWSRRA